MEDVAAVGFASSALQHNVKLPDLDLPAELAPDAAQQQAIISRSRPSPGQGSAAPALLPLLYLLDSARLLSKLFHMQTVFCCKQLQKKLFCSPCSHAFRALLDNARLHCIALVR